MALGVDEGNVSNVEEIFERSKNTEDSRAGIPSYSVGGLCGAQPLGYVLLKSGKLCPFGLLPPATEADALGDPAEWVEIRVNPPSLMWTSEEPFICPAEFCKEKMRKNYSMESHVRKHIWMIVNRSINAGLNDAEAGGSDNKGRGQLSPDLCIRYCCNAKECGYGLSVPGETKFFSCLKYLKQHYFKVHAPKTHQCERCDKCFSTAGFLDTHQRMCGNTFHCSSCGSSYSTLEALQTHCKRKQHTYDYTKYKDILSSFKQIQQSKKAEEHLKQKLAAVSINSSPPETSSKKLNQLPILIPRPTTITLSVDGASTSHVAWTYEDKSDVPRVRKEMATQTVTEESNETKPCIDTQYGKSSSANNVRNTKRKKSAETQTGKVTFRISTETQTSNVTKRRRTSKKHIAEAETQCTELIPASPAQQFQEYSTNSPANWNSTSFSGETFMDASTPQATSAEISIPLVMHLAGIIGSSGIESKDNCLSFRGSQEFVSNPLNLMEISTSTATIGVGNRFDEDLQELFDFNEELHQETQTDPTLFSSSSVSMSISPQFEDFRIGDSVFNNFTTAETQTFAGVCPPQVGLGHEESQTHSRNSVSVASHSEDWLTFLDSPGSNLYDFGSSNSPSFLETMDNETQTQSPYSEYEDFFKTVMDSEPFERM